MLLSDPDGCLSSLALAKHRIPMVLDTVVGATWQMLCDGDPFVSQSGVNVVENAFLIGAPRILFDARTELIEISFSTLFTGASGQLGGDSTPSVGGCD